MGERVNKWLVLLVALPSAIILIVSVAYASYVGTASKQVDLTVPLIINAAIPTCFLVFMSFMAKRYIKGVDDINKELIRAKNDHADRLSKVEMTQHMRGCDLAVESAGG